MHMGCLDLGFRVEGLQGFGCLTRDQSIGFMGLRSFRGLEALGSVYRAYRS